MVEEREQVFIGKQRDDLDRVAVPTPYIQQYFYSITESETHRTQIWAWESALCSAEIIFEIKMMVKALLLGDTYMICLHNFSPSDSRRWRQGDQSFSLQSQIDVDDPIACPYFSNTNLGPNWKDGNFPVVEAVLYF